MLLAASAGKYLNYNISGLQGLYVFGICGPSPDDPYMYTYTSFCWIYLSAEEGGVLDGEGEGGINNKSQTEG